MRKRFLNPAVWASMWLVGMGFGINCAAESPASGDFRTSEKVGRVGPNRYYTPANQLLTPEGKQVDLPGMRPQAIALSPNGKLLVTSGKTHELVVIDPATGGIRQRVALPAGDAEAAGAPVSEQILHPDLQGQLSFTGLLFSPDGARLYLSDVQGKIKVFTVDAAGQVAPGFSISLPKLKSSKSRSEIPAGLALSPDGRKLYVALNLSNQLAELDAARGKVLRVWECGVAPYGVAVVRNKVYVSNWGGRLPGKGDLTGPAGRGTTVRVDRVRHIASEGTVTIIDLEQEAGAHAEPKQIRAGLHACALEVSPNGRHLVVANAGSDTLTVIDTRTDQVVETIWARVNPSDLFGAQPSALVFAPDGKRLFVCNGTQNAVAVFEFRPGASKMAGMIPVGWFPGGIAYDRIRKALCVANIKGIGSTHLLKPGEKEEFNSHQSFGTVSLLPVPSKKALSGLTARVLQNMRYPLLEEAARPARPGMPPRPVPERVGEPSVFNHVIYVIKENRTYDQVLGDMPEGNGDKSLCIFGEKVSPNFHKLAREFVLLDNTYCSGICSADGHQWADSGLVNDYLERSFAGFPRSYVHGMTDGGVDALAYSSTGFIWDNAIAHGRTLRDYGEFAITEAHWKDRAKTRAPRFRDFYRDYLLQSGEIEIGCRPAIESLRPFLVTNTVGWALDIPDAFRAARFIEELKQFEQQGEYPALTIVCLPNDHTSGARPGAPTPAAQAADNDLAFGRIVEAVSRSQFWKDTCIFAIEDDPQAGWDHVSGYRTTCYLASPYTVRGARVSTQYNQTSLLRTMELMLGLPPMNQLDATATPMTDCFTNTPDFRPYQSLTNNIPLDQMNPEVKEVRNKLLRKQARESARLPLAEADKCPEDQLNRILWHALKGPDAAYPLWAIKADED